MMFQKVIQSIIYFLNFTLFLITNLELFWNELKIFKSRLITLFDTYSFQKETLHSIDSPVHELVKRVVEVSRTASVQEEDSVEWKVIDDSNERKNN